MMAAFMISVPPPAQAQTPISASWTAFYWNNANFQGNPVVGRTDAAINFNWAGGSPDPAVPADNFSARWTSSINFQTAGTFRLRAGADDGIRVAVDGAIVIDRFTAASAFTLVTQDVNLGAGVRNFVVDYFEGTGNAGVLFEIIPVAGGGIVPGATATPLGTLAFGTPAPAVDTRPVKAEVIVQRANLRSGPGTRFPQIGEATLGQTFVVLAKNGDFGMETWFLIDLGGSRAWVYRRNVYVYGGSFDALPRSQEVVGAPAGSETGVTVVQVTGLARADVVVRDIPSQRSGQRIGVISRGESFLVLQLSRNRAWIKVNYNGLIGWVYLPNVRITSGRLGSLPRGDS